MHYGRHYYELLGVVQHEPYGLRGVHNGRHYCELSRVVQHESYGLRGVHYERHYCELYHLSKYRQLSIAAGSEREERGMGGLHHGRLWKANVASSLVG